MVRYRTPKSAGTQRTMAAALSPKIRLQHLCMLGLQLHTDKYCILPCLPSIIHFFSSCHSVQKLPCIRVPRGFRCPDDEAA